MKMLETSFSCIPVKETSPSPGRPEFSASRCVARLPIVDQIFTKKRQFWQLFASGQLIETKLLSSEQVTRRNKSENLYIFHL